MNGRQTCGKVHEGMKVQRVVKGRSDWQTQEANGQVRDIREGVLRGVGRSEGRYMVYAGMVPSILHIDSIRPTVDSP